MKPRFVVRNARNPAKDSFGKEWFIIDTHTDHVIEFCPTRKHGRERAHELNLLQQEWKADTQGKAAE